MRGIEGESILTIPFVVGVVVVRVEFRNGVVGIRREEVQIAINMYRMSPVRLSLEYSRGSTMFLA